MTYEKGKKKYFRNNFTYFRNNNSFARIRWFDERFEIRFANDWSFRHYRRREPFSIPGSIIFPIDKEGRGAVNGQRRILAAR